MAGVTAIIAVVALCIGLTSVWLVTDAIKKIEKRSQKMVEVQIKGLRQLVADLNKAVLEQKAAQEAVVNRVRDVVRNRESADGELSSLRREVDAITGALGHAGKKAGRSGS